MFEALATAVDEVEADLGAGELRELLAVHDRLQAKLAVALGRFDDAGGWCDTGATSLTGWLRTESAMGADVAAATARVAKRVHKLPAVREAWLGGVVGSGQVRAIVANLSDETMPLFQEQEETVLCLVRDLDPRDTTRVMQKWKRLADDQVGRGPREPKANELHHSKSLDGRWHGSFNLDALNGAILDHALRLATCPDGAGAERSPAERRADAMMTIVRRFLGTNEAPRRRHRPHVTIVLSHQDMHRQRPGRFVDHRPLDWHDTAMLLCDCSINRLIVDGKSTILDQGRDQRLFTDAQFRAIVARDGHCRFDDCDRPPEDCDVHHVVPYPDGPTDLGNGALFCAAHHRRIHRQGWELKLLPDGTVTATHPKGHHWESRPPPIAGSG